MGALFDMFKEKANNFFSFVTPESKERRDARQAMHIEEEIPILEKKEQAAEEQGDLEGVEKYLEKIRTMEEKAAFDDFDELVQTRLLLTYQLRLYSYIMDAVERNLHADASLGPEQKQAIKEGVEMKLLEARKELAQIITGVFRQETSFASINLTLRKLQKTDTVAKDVYSFYRNARAAARKTNKIEKKLVKESRNPKELGAEQFLNQVNLFRKSIQSERTTLLEAANGTMMLLQRDTADLKEKEEHVKELMRLAGFPKPIGQQLVKKYDETLLRINKALHEEIEKKRIEMSNAQRIA